MSEKGTNSVFDLVEQTALTVHNIRNSMHMLQLSLEKINRDTRQAVDMLKANKAEDEQVISIIEGGQLRIDRMLLKMKDTLELVNSQQRTFSKQLDVREVDLKSLFDELIECSRNEVSKKFEVIYNIEVSGTVLLSRFRILQVLGNIIQNSFQAIEQGKCPEGLLYIACYEEAGELVIKVTDNGIGVEKQVLEQIGTLGYTTKKTGHGFGIYSCKRIIQEECQGRLEVASTGKNEGTVVTVVLPV